MSFWRKRLPCCFLTRQVVAGKNSRKRLPRAIARRFLPVIRCAPEAELYGLRMRLMAKLRDADLAGVEPVRSMARSMP
jgi:hypothetical protein